MAAKLALVGATVLTALGLVSCSTVTDGNPVCPGCGSGAEPTVPTARPPVNTPTAAPPTSSAVPAPEPTATAAPGPGVETLPTTDSGYVYIETKSGKTRCQLNSEQVGCEAAFENSPDIGGEPANGVNVTASGDLTWLAGNIGAIPTVTIDYRTYAAVGWTIEASTSGTRFTNDSTGHGMFVSVEGVQSF